MTLGWRAHGAARVAAGLGPDPGLPPELPEAMREQLLGAELSEEDVHLAWELARLAPGLSARDHLALTMLAVLTQEALSRGSTRLAIGDREALAARARTLGADADLAARAAALLDRVDEPPLDAVFGPDRPLVIEGAHLYHQRLRAVETRLAARVAERVAHAVAPIDAAEALARLRAHPAVTPAGPLVLTEEQEAAIRAALEGPLTVISGGPGTGKTSIVVAILRAAVLAPAIALDPSSIALAAPTGKAADRMRQAIDGALAMVADPTEADARLRRALPPPRTLHRLLGFSPSRGGFRHHADNPLAERLVVVDESSMVDVFLMERLVASLHPAARLVLLGDAEQLPSVAAGAVFRDLGRAPRVPSVRLTQSHRMDPRRPEGFNVLRVAAQVNEGRTPPLVPPADGLPADLEAIGRVQTLPEPLDALGGVFLHDPPSRREREAFLDAWYRDRFGDPDQRAMASRTWAREEGRLTDGAVGALFDAMERARLLCVTRSATRPTGVEAVNESLHRRHANATGAPPGARWTAGEPLLVMRNDYERGLFNGDQGLVLWTRGEDDPSPRPSAVFRRDDGFAAHPLEAVRSSVELGFATTVHKAQGSEHDAVALLLPETDSPRLLTREIVYTAITRARRAVLVVGRRALLERAVERRVERSTGVRERLEPGPDETSRDTE
ncbi:MAG TPA: AAA family ATPase [Sandaracinaceae bacterium LLY-WYZ-13_1]|nr:AAA family ATPase [Sandaracinaceae bacterium LLY-WYZ-13_1]